MLSYTTMRFIIITINISECRHFSDSHISQSSVATYVMWWNVYIRLSCKFTTESVSERILKIG